MKKIITGLLVLLTTSIFGMNLDQVNTASKETLMSIYGVGEVKAEAIIKERKKAKFKSFKDLERVTGIGEQIAQNIKNNVRLTTKVKKSATKKTAKKSTKSKSKTASHSTLKKKRKIKSLDKKKKELKTKAKKTKTKKTKVKKTKKTKKTKSKKKN